MTVLSSLRGRHVNDLAGTILNNDETVLAKRGALHRISGGGAGIGTIKGVLMLMRLC